VTVGATHWEKAERCCIAKEFPDVLTTFDASNIEDTRAVEVYEMVRYAPFTLARSARREIERAMVDMA